MPQRRKGQSRNGVGILGGPMVRIRLPPAASLRRRFRHRRAGGPLTGLAPAGNGFFNEPSLGIMLREELGLVFDHLGEMGFERCSDLRVQLLPGTAQQAAMRCVLHQRVLERYRSPRAARLFGRPARKRRGGRGRFAARPSGRRDTARNNSYENSRPIAAPICATSRTDARRCRLLTSAPRSGHLAVPSVPRSEHDADLPR
jgi:hypothetical protein